MNELFPIEESLSPKLAWLRAHGLEVWKTESEDEPWTCAKFSNGLPDMDGAVFADTEEEVILSWCARTGLVHYSIE